jgi:hypothetical protein
MRSLTKLPIVFNVIKRQVSRTFEPFWIQKKIATAKVIHPYILQPKTASN